MAATRQRGTQLKAVYKLQSAAQSASYDTAIAGSTGDAIRAQISLNVTTQELVKNPISSGLDMQDEIVAGRVTPVATVSGDVGFESGPDRIAAQFFGAVTSAAEQTTSQGDYLHRFTLDPDANNVYGTLAWQVDSADTFELPSAAARTFTTSFTEVSQFLQFSSEMLGSSLDIASSVNDYSTIASATMADTDCVTVTSASEFWINAASGGALSSSNRFSIKSYTRTLNRPQDFVGLVSGTSGNSAPVVSDLIIGTLDVTVDALDNLDYFTAWAAGNDYKCLFQVEGSQIGTGDNKTWAEFSPKMRLVQAPVANLENPGFNEVSMSFVLLQATAAPTGMDSTKPYLEITNEKATDYIA